jgi:hypothetical protein
VRGWPVVCGALHDTPQSNLVKQVMWYCHQFGMA